MSLAPSSTAALLSSSWDDDDDDDAWLLFAFLAVDETETIDLSTRSGTLAIQLMELFNCSQFVVLPRRTDAAISSIDATNLSPSLAYILDAIHRIKLILTHN